MAGAEENMGENFNEIASLIAGIKSLDSESMAAAADRLDNLTKPQGSLGRLEGMAVQLAGIYRSPLPQVGKAAVMVCAADHGIVAKGVTSFPSAVTRLMFDNFKRDGAAVNQIARVCDAEVFVYDIGIGTGTADMSEGSAMTRQQCIDTVLYGADEAGKLIDDGASVICLGEMGIGNSSAAAALTAAFTGADVETVVGRGAGLDDESLARKATLIKQSLSVNEVKQCDALGKLAAVGGLEIAMMAGIILGCAARAIPVVSDGFISGSAVLAAVEVAREERKNATGDSIFEKSDSGLSGENYDNSDCVMPYVIFSHRSVEPGHRAMYDYLNARPLFDLDLRLGEGSGAVLSLPMIRSAAEILSGMETFDEAGIVL